MSVKLEPTVPISEFAAELPRLSSGHLCALLLMAFWNHKTTVFTVEYLAEHCRFKSEAVRRELTALVDRGLIEVFTDGPNLVVEVKYKNWASLPDYKGDKA
jgi:predicted transcriptional regulator